MPPRRTSGFRRKLLSLVAAAMAFGSIAAAAPAYADGWEHGHEWHRHEWHHRGHEHRWHHRHGWHEGWGGPRGYYAPPPTVIYAAPPPPNLVIPLR